MHSISVPVNITIFCYNVNKTQFVLEMSTKSFDTSTKTSMPLSDCGIDDALIDFIPRGDDTFSQLTDVLHVVFVNMHHRPDFVVCWIKVRAVRWPKCWWYEVRSFFNISTVSCHIYTMRRSIILTSTLQSKARTPAASGTRIKLLYTASNFLKHFVNFWKKLL